MANPSSGSRDGDREPIELELEFVAPGEYDPAAVDALLEALAELCVDAWLARRRDSPEDGVAA